MRWSGLVVLAGCLVSVAAHAKTATWTFETSADYQLSDASSLRVQGGARLLPFDFTDDDFTAAGFGGGTMQGADWDAGSAALTVGATNIWALPDGSVTSDWTSMAGNLLLLHLDEPVGATTFADTSAFSRVLACTGGCPTAAVSGRLGTALAFDGSDDALMLQPWNDVPDAAITISFWMRTTDTTHTGTPVSYAAAGQPDELVITNYQNFVIRRRNSSTGATGVSANDGAWHHLVVTWQKSGGTVILYKDGVLAFQGTIGAGKSLKNNGALVLGQEQDSLGGGFAVAEAFAGQLDEVAVYSRVLSAAEIAAQYARQRVLRAGRFESRHLDATSPLGWNALAWTARYPSLKPLPGDRVLETAFAAGNADMSGNVLLYHVDELTGAILDDSGFGHAGTYTGILHGRPGRFQSALGFDGVDDLVSVPDAALLNPTTALTMATWVYAEVAPTGHAGLLVKGSDATASAGLLVQADAGDTAECANSFTDADIRAAVRVNGTRVVACWGNLHTQLYTWHHLAATYDGQALRLFWDGAERATVLAPGILTTTADPLTLGAPQFGGTYFRGRLDELALFARALSATEIRDHYLRGAVRVQLQVRVCAASPCTGAWVGSDGTAASFFTDAANATVALPSATLTGQTGRYLQYRAELESDDLFAAAGVSRVTAGPARYAVSPPWVVNLQGPTYTSLSGFAQVVGSAHAGAIRYQVSPNGTDWFFHTGTRWQPAAGFSQSNTADDLHFRLPTMPRALGNGHFHFRAFLDSVGGAKQAELAQVQLTYDDVLPGVTTTSPSDGGSTGTPVSGDDTSGSDSPTPPASTTDGGGAEGGDTPPVVDAPLGNFEFGAPGCTLVIPPKAG